MDEKDKFDGTEKIEEEEEKVYIARCLEANSQKKGQHGLKEASALKSNITRSQG